MSKGSLTLDYGQVFRDHLETPLQKGGMDKTVTNMSFYSLLRGDLDDLLEVTQWPDKPHPLESVSSKTKAALTRKYNKKGIALPYSVGRLDCKKNDGGEDTHTGH